MWFKTDVALTADQVDRKNVGLDLTVAGSEEPTGSAETGYIGKERDLGR